MWNNTVSKAQCTDANLSFPPYMKQLTKIQYVEREHVRSGAKAGEFAQGTVWGADGVWAVRDFTPGGRARDWIAGDEGF